MANMNIHDRLSCHCFCCNKSIFQKHKNSKNLSISDVRTCLKISKSMSIRNRRRFLEYDCQIDYKNAITYIDKIEQLEHLYNKHKPSINTSMFIQVVVISLCVKVVEFSTISSLVHTISHSIVHPT
jgi:hypothetical protein